MSDASLLLPASNFLETQVGHESDTQILETELPNYVVQIVENFLQDTILAEDESQSLPAATHDASIDLTPTRRCTAASSSMPHMSVTVAGSEGVADTVD